MISSAKCANFFWVHRWLIKNSTQKSREPCRWESKMRSGAGFLSGFEARKLGSTLFCFSRVYPLFWSTFIFTIRIGFFCWIWRYVSFLPWPVLLFWTFGHQFAQNFGHFPAFLTILPFDTKLHSPSFAFIQILFALFAYFHVANHSETLPADNVQWGGGDDAG